MSEDIVLIHGTSQDPTSWQLLISSLQLIGKRCFTVDLPNEDIFSSSQFSEIAKEQIPSKVQSPVVVAHSGSGLLLPAIARKLNASHQIWLAAMIPISDQRSFLEEASSNPTAIFNEEWIGENPIDDVVSATYFLFHDCSFITLRWALTTRREFIPIAVYKELIKLEPSIPSTCIVATKDRTIKPNWLKQIARERLNVEPIEVPSSHCPHISQPDYIAQIIAEAC